MHIISRYRGRPRAPFRFNCIPRDDERENRYIKSSLIRKNYSRWSFCADRISLYRPLLIDTNFCTQSRIEKKKSRLISPRFFSWFLNLKNHMFLMNFNFATYKLEKNILYDWKIIPLSLQFYLLYIYLFIYLFIYIYLFMYLFILISMYLFEKFIIS